MVLKQKQDYLVTILAIPCVYVCVYRDMYVHNALIKFVLHILIQMCSLI